MLRYVNRTDLALKPPDIYSRHSQISPLHCSKWRCWCRRDRPLTNPQIEEELASSLVDKVRQQDCSHPYLHLNLQVETHGEFFDIWAYSWSYLRLHRWQNLRLECFNFVWNCQASYETRSCDISRTSHREWLSSQSPWAIRLRKCRRSTAGRSQNLREVASWNDCMSVFVLGPLCACRDSWGTKVMFIYLRVCGAAPPSHTLNNNKMTQ